MKAAPVRRHRQPVYPTRLEVQSDPHLLRNHVPPAWRAVPEMAGAVALFLAVNAVGCRNDAKRSATAVVAPIFEHGEGRGATGCVVTAPPVFLSEQEAMQVIREELAGHGVSLSESDRPVPRVKLPRRAFETRYKVWGIRVPEMLLTLANRAGRTLPSSVKRELKQFEDYEHAVPLKADGFDPKQRLAVEYVSQADESELSRCSLHRVSVVSSVQSYDSKAAAGKVVQQVRQQAVEHLYFGTFYDPMLPLNFGRLSDGAREDYASHRESLAAESKHLLRLQVQDFVKWLQAQGAI